MEPVKISATELRQKTRDLMERVQYKGEHLLIENFHRPIAVVISYQDYVRYREIMDKMGDSLPFIEYRSGQAEKENS